MLNRIIEASKPLAYSFLLFALVLGSFYLPTNQASADTVSGGGPGTISIYSISPSTIAAGESVTVTGFPIGGDTLDNDCAFPPATNHQYYAYPLTTPRYNVDGGQNKAYTLTQTQAGNSHSTCTTSPHEADVPYLYSFSITIPGADTQSLTPGVHTVTVKATDPNYGVITDQVEFTVTGGNDPIGGSYNLTCDPNERTIAPGYSASYTATSTRSDNFNGTIQNFSVSGVPAGASVNYSPSPPAIALSSSTPSGSVGVSIVTTPSVTPGQYSLSISADSGTGTPEVHCDVTLKVEADAPPDGGATPSAYLTANGAHGTVNVTANSTAELNGTCTNAASLKILGTGVSINIPNGTSGTGDTPIIPSGTSYTYTLTCYQNANYGGTSDTDQVTVASQNTPSYTADISISENGTTYTSAIPIASGDTVYVKWTATLFNNNDCNVAPTGWSGRNGNQTVNNVTTTVDYVLTCDNGAGTRIVDTASAQVLTADIKAAGLDGPITVEPNSNVLITWSSQYAKSCRITPTIPSIGSGWGIGTQSSAGSPKTANITASITYTLTCSENLAGGGDQATDTVTINIPNPDFSISCDLGKTVSAGTSTFFNNTLTASGGFASQVTVTVTAGLPSGASSTPVTVTPTAIASVPVTTSGSTPAGTFPLTFTATGGGLTRVCVSNLWVTPEDGPALDHLVLTPDPATINKGDTQSYESMAWYTDGTSQSVTAQAGYDSLDTNIATMSGNVATGEGNGSVTINARYSEGGVSVSDTAILNVGALPSLSANLTCPSGQQSCSIPYNTAVSLTWSSTSATSCSTSPVLSPPAASTSGTSSTGNLIATTQYELTCIDGSGNQAKDSVTVSVNPPGASLITSDKDISAVNGVPIATSFCNGGTDSVGNITFKSGDKVTFKINVCNTGSADATGLTLTDQLTNLTEPDGGWNAQWNGNPVSPDSTTGTAPNQILTFNVGGTLKPSPTNPWNGTLTFDAIVTAPNSSNTLFRFQNGAVINTGSNSWTRTTPLYLFYAGSKVPRKEEVAP